MFDDTLVAPGALSGASATQFTAKTSTNSRLSRPSSETLGAINDWPRAASQFAPEILRALGVRNGRHKTIETIHGPEQIRWDDRRQRFYGEDHQGPIHKLVELVKGDHAAQFIKDIARGVTVNRAAKRLADQEKRRRYALNLYDQAQDIDLDGRIGRYLRDTRGIRNFAGVHQHMAPVAYRNLEGGHVEPSRIAPSLVAFARNAYGRIAAAQCIQIDANGQKLTGKVVTKRTVGSPKGAYALFGNQNSRKIIICEGIETGLSLAEAFPNHLILVCLGPLRIECDYPAIANAVEVTIHVELDRKTGKPKADDLDKAHAAVPLLPNAHWLLAHLDDPAHGTDANDLHRALGLDAVILMLAQARSLQGPAAVAYDQHGVELDMASEELDRLFKRYLRQITTIINEIREAKKARRRHSHIKRFVRALNATAGLGKTRRALMILVAELLKLGHVRFHVPEHKLAAQIVADAQQLGLPARHIIGRDPQFEGAPVMCENLEAAKAIQAANMSVTSSLCARVVGVEPDGSARYAYCPFHPKAGGNCRTIRQFQPSYQDMPDGTKVEINELWVMPAEYGVTSTPEVPLANNVALSIFDEDIGAADQTPHKDHFDLTLGHLALTPAVWAEDGDGEWQLNQAATDDLAQLCRTISEAIATEEFTPVGLRDRGITRNVISTLRQVISNDIDNVPLADIRPSWNPAQIAAAVRGQTESEQFKRRRSLRRYGKLLRALEACIDHDKTGELRAVKVRHTNDLGPVLVILRRASIRTAGYGNLLLLDASAKADLIGQLDERLTPDKLDLVQADTPLMDASYLTGAPTTMNKLCPTDRRSGQLMDTTTARNHRADWAAQIEALARRTPGPLMVTSYKLLCDAKSPISFQHEHPHLLKLDIKFAWFNSLRGSNDYERCAADLIIGRPRPSPEAIEDAARAWFFDDDEPLQYLEDINRMPKRPTLLRSRHGERFEVFAEYHPDPRINQIFERICADELYQDAHRPRGVRRICQLILATDQPPDITFDRVISWGDFIASDIDLAALRAGHGHGVLPLSARCMAETFPDLWNTEEKARKALEKQGLQSQKLVGQTPIDKIKQLANWLGGCETPVSLVKFWRHSRGKGRAMFALVLDDGDISPQARLRSTIGLVAACDIVTAITSDATAKPIELPPDPEPASTADVQLGPQHQHYVELLNEALFTGVFSVDGRDLANLHPDLWPDPGDAWIDAIALDSMAGLYQPKLGWIALEYVPEGCPKTMPRRVWFDPDRPIEQLVAVLGPISAVRVDDEKSDFAALDELTGADMSQPLPNGRDHTVFKVRELR